MGDTRDSDFREIGLDRLTEVRIVVAVQHFDRFEASGRTLQREARIGRADIGQETRTIAVGLATGIEQGFRDGSDDRNCLAGLHGTG